MSKQSKMNSIIRRLVDSQPVIAGKTRTMKSHCGKPGCKCMRKTNPEKHVYHQLSCTKDKKTKTMYADLELVQKLNEHYVDLRMAALDLGHEAVVLSKAYGVDTACKMMMGAFDREKRKSIGLKPESQLLRETGGSRDKWKKKALQRQADLASKAVRVRDVEKSRDKWKKKAMDAQNKSKDLQKALVEMNRNVNKMEKDSFNKKNSSEAK